MFRLASGSRTWQLVALLLPLLLGCGSKTSVSGTVTYDGREVDKCFITFYPADDRGTAVGSEILDGKYAVPELVPGKKRVLIKSQWKPVGVEASGAGGRKIKLVPPDHAVPADATGNNQTVDILGGEQTLDFRLTKPQRH
ncbi:MAG TPA: hypothetical protein VG013_22280 [Gemmataceae bacterium]|jgi:hypothetical protein|nr:hypothetical protein [Gemmataceae bacterium]